MYFVISNSDGDTYVSQLETKKTLLVVPREKTRVVELDVD